MAATQVCQGKNEAEIERRMRDMNPENAEVLQELLEVVRRQRKEEEENRTYTWLEDCDINLWGFRDKHPGMMRGLQDELDPEVWEDVAPRLGLTYQQIERCRKCHTGSYAREMFNTLAVNPQHRDLTLKAVLEVLLHLERHDILRRLQGFDCLKKTERCTMAKSFTLTIQRPREVLVTARNTGTTPEATNEMNDKLLPPPRFVAKVLVIHASDAKEDALRLAEYLRSPARDRRCNVLLLQESENSTVKTWLEIDPYNSIHKWFMMVHVVVPVLSPQFLRQIQNRDSDTTVEWEKRFNRYVYRMVLDQYVEMGSKNYYCRAVCPARYQSEMANNKLVRLSGLLQMHYNCSSESQLEEYARILYSGAKAVRKMKLNR